MRDIKVKYIVEKDDFMRAGQASSNIKKLLKKLGLEAQILRRVAIATYEAEMNIIIHSEGGFIELEIKPDKIMINIEDSGPGIKDVDLAMQTGYSTASNKIRELGFGAGMGLPNIKRCCDEFDIKSSLGEYTRLELLIYNE